MGARYWTVCLRAAPAGGAPLWLDTAIGCKPAPTSMATALALTVGIVLPPVPRERSDAERRGGREARYARAAEGRPQQGAHAHGALTRTAVEMARQRDCGDAPVPGSHPRGQAWALRSAEARDAGRYCEGQCGLGRGCDGWEPHAIWSGGVVKAGEASPAADLHGVQAPRPHCSSASSSVAAPSSVPVAASAS